MVPSRWWLPLFLLCLAGPALAQGINWQDAVARLREERGQAETCVRVLKKYGDATAVDRGAVAYAEAKAEYDAIIAGLNVALAQKEQPASLSDLQERLRRGFKKRDAFCQSVRPLLPPRSGEKGILDEIVKGAVEPL